MNHLERTPRLTGSEQGAKQSTSSGLGEDNMQDGSFTAAQKFFLHLLTAQVLIERAARARGKMKRDREGRPSMKKDNLWMVHPKEQPGRPSLVHVAQVSLEQGSEHPYCKGQGVSISSFEGQIVCLNYSTLPFRDQRHHKQYVNECVAVCQ